MCFHLYQHSEKWGVAVGARKNFRRGGGGAAQKGTPIKSKNAPYIEKKSEKTLTW